MFLTTDLHGFTRMIFWSRRSRRFSRFFKKLKTKNCTEHEFHEYHEYLCESVKSVRDLKTKSLFCGEVGYHLAVGCEETGTGDVADEVVVNVDYW